jgi:tryptophan-rich sensory protein
VILLGVLAACWGLAVALIGAWLTELSPWYYALRKPSWQPPDWAFGPAWSVILALASVALYLGWRDAPDAGTRALIVALFVANGVFNIFWSPLFFTWRRPDWALLEVPLLWLSILAPMIVMAPFSRAAALLLLPYLLWVSFATVLNVAIVRLNRPFGARAGVVAVAGGKR